MENKYHITISRQFGSLGRMVGMKLAEILDIPFYDRDIVEEAARQLNIPLSEASRIEEREKSRFSFMKYPLGGGTSMEIKERLFVMQTKIIMEWAEKSSCVFVGRCSDFILKDDPAHINFFIYAPIEVRLRNCVKELGMKPNEAMKMINDVDKARYAYHKRYTRFSQKDLELNHVMIDSSLLGVDGTAEIMADIVRKRMQL